MWAHKKCFETGINLSQMFDFVVHVEQNTSFEDAKDLLLMSYFRFDILWK